MTKEEIKRQYSMIDILHRYGLQPNRAGFIKCPFHREKTGSMKIYRDNYYCYGCGETGDIFTFVMKMDGLSFKDAFVSLGGHYDKTESKLDAYHRTRDLVVAERKRQEELERIKKIKKSILHYGNEMDGFRELMKAYEPLSDDWFDCLEGYTDALIHYDQLREEVIEVGSKH